MKIIRQCTGVDCSKDTLDVALSFLDEDFNEQVHAMEVFSNSKTGFNRLLRWINKHRVADLPMQIVVEATGVYHEQLAYHVHQSGWQVVVVLPNKIRHYYRSTPVRTVNDRISARQIASFGLMKKLDAWTPPQPVYAHLRVLSRERIQLLEEKTIVLNQLHAHQCEVMQPATMIRRCKQRIAFLEKQSREIEKEMQQVVNANDELKEKLKNLCTIPGVAIITAITIAAETNGFHLFRNYKQLVCYAGYDVVDKQSGTSVKKKARISATGNKYIRRALHFPALTAVKWHLDFKNFYDRLYDRQRIKMKSYTAIQRKILTLIYTLWKNNESFNPGHTSNQHKFLEQPQMEAALTELDQVRS